VRLPVIGIARQYFSQPDLVTTNLRISNITPNTTNGLHHAKDRTPHAVKAYIDKVEAKCIRAHI
jgi:hypothetical protein